MFEIHETLKHCLLIGIIAVIIARRIEGDSTPDLMEERGGSNFGQNEVLGCSE